MQFVVLSSSRGTTFQAVIDAIKRGTLTAHCAGLIADREARGCVEKAKEAGIPVAIVHREKGEEREDYDRKVDRAIHELLAHDGKPAAQSFSMKKPDTVIACMGWMFILSPWFVQTWHNRILNIHPALLPLFPGADAIRDALEAGATETGMTIHLIDEGVDTGTILVQKSCSILPDDTEEELKERVQALEKEWYPKILQEIHEGEMKLP